MKGFSSSIRGALLDSKFVVGLFAGLFLALVIFFSASPQFSWHSPNDLLREPPGDGGSGAPVEVKNDLAPAPANLTAESPAVSKQQAHGKEEPTNFTGNLRAESPGVSKQQQEPTNHTASSPAPAVPPLKPICDRSDRRYDGCEMWGDARTASGVKNSRVFFIPPASQLSAAAAANWSIRSQSRKYVGVREVVVRSLNLSDLHDAPNCTLWRRAPAVVFAVGGLTFNYWHSFSDVLVPLYTTARAFDGDVELLATDTRGGSREWFLRKFRGFLGALSRFEPVDLDADREVRCYPHLVVGLRGHRDFDIDPARTPAHYDMRAFRLFIREAYALPPPSVALPCKNNRRPRAMVILRARTRRFVNGDEVVAAVERAGFDVTRMEPGQEHGVDEVARAVDKCDVLVGAHGAGLTNMVFLRTGAVVVQVVPWGNMEPYAEGYFGRPAAHMGVRYVAYSVAAEESSLYEKYGRDSPVINDPIRFYKNGTNAKYYWQEQNIRLNTTRFMPTLEKVKRMLLQE
ncbi:hypothetical protein PR202_ga15255 [Eleusine coracana subsp. coracana]|uniref:Glycosyltransferase 61 catalytic domain-containing protein n=1 Tax=Eleusine coracana subsp. coracana TaxID=191504 RepID=A0AAV5CJ91_ELECO|nr:hypothetical protein QOZ80_6BG0495140 [Eleusine coracana subsp. coracana]GJM98265.1 hypothetical protein PR202_ga15255 [Eleusine coracana subsp. coracana]